MKYKILQDILSPSGVVAVHKDEIVEAGPIKSVMSHGSVQVPIMGIEITRNNERIAIEQSLFFTIMESGVDFIPFVPPPSQTSTNISTANTEYCEVADKVGHMVAYNRAWRIGAIALIGLALYGLYRLLKFKTAAV